MEKYLVLKNSNREVFKEGLIVEVNIDLSYEK